MRRISLIAVDLDGTLLTSKKGLAPQSVVYLMRAVKSGIWVILSTARNPGSATAFAREMGLDEPLICTNGTQLLASPNGPIWMRNTIEQEAAARIAAFADEKGWYLTTTIDDMDYMRPDPAKPYPENHRWRTVVDRNIDGITGSPVRILTTHPDAIIGLSRFCSEYLFGRVQTVVFSGRSIGIFPPGVDKGTCLSELLKRLGVAKEEVLAIGDDECDLAMPPHSGEFIIMENASDTVKAQAHDICPTNDSEGVAWAVAKHVFNETLEPVKQLDD